LIDVSDKEILEGIIEMARESGVFAEPAGATALAGFKKCARQGLLSLDSRVVIVVTGNGLKDLKSPSSIMPALRKLPPDRKIIEEEIGEDRFQS
jgi:threonine synthase